MAEETTSCQPISARDSRPSFDVTAHRVACGVGGIWHLGDWISAEEEAALTNRIYSEHSQDWTKLRDRRLLHLGGSPCDALGQGIDREPLPPWAQAVCDELVQRGIFPEKAPPNHVLLNEYMPGQGIAAHKDGPLYASRVAVLSLGSHATFQFVSAVDGATAAAASLLLPPRGMLVFAGTEAYTQHLHSVPPCKEDDLLRPGLVRLDDGQHASGAGPGDPAALDAAGQPPRFLPRERRLSLTLRRLRYKWEANTISDTF